MYSTVRETIVVPLRCVKVKLFGYDGYEPVRGAADEEIEFGWLGSVDRVSNERAPLSYSRKEALGVRKVLVIAGLLTLGILTCALILSSFSKTHHLHPNEEAPDLSVPAATNEKQGVVSKEEIVKADTVSRSLAATNQTELVDGENTEEEFPDVFDEDGETSRDLLDKTEGPSLISEASPSFAKTHGMHSNEEVLDFYLPAPTNEKQGIVSKETLSKTDTMSPSLIETNETEKVDGDNIDEGNIVYEDDEEESHYNDLRIEAEELSLIREGSQIRELKNLLKELQRSHDTLEKKMEGLEKNSKLSE